MTGADQGVREPLQARSRESARRLVDAGLVVLARDGIQGLTVAAVSRESGVSNGSLYHRYGGRDQLLAACQARFFERNFEKWREVGARPVAQDDPLALLDLVIDAFDEVFGEQRKLFQAFMIAGHSNATLRSGGREFSRMAAGIFADLFVRRTGASAEAADAAYRLLFGRAVLRMMLDEDEISGLDVAPELQRQHIRDAMAAILGIPPRPQRSAGRRRPG